MQLNEDFLHYIWRYRLLTKLSLHCTNGEVLQILDPGLQNIHAGPDFSTARLIIGGQEWVGNVEIHVKSSDWHLHHHQRDKAYDTVILHAVYDHDEVICRTDGTLIPVLSLKDLIPEERYATYMGMMENRNPFPCARQISNADQMVTQKMLLSMSDLRFMEKTAEVEYSMKLNHNNWNQTFYEMLFKNFGFKVNALPFELLSRRLPHTLIAKHRDNALQVEALLFGQAGFLEAEFTDVYPKQLKAEYGFLKKKYLLQPGEGSLWKFMRMHPQNFPMLRIAQLSGLLTNRTSLFSSMLELTNLKDLLHIFSSVQVHPYWKDHSHFDRKSREISLKLGRKSIESLIINTVAVMCYYYGEYCNQQQYKDRAAWLLTQIPVERNSITSHYVKAGLSLTNAQDSQACLQLHKSYCLGKRCLSCAIGINIISPSVL